MSDKRRHRGAHPNDCALFSDKFYAALKNATSDLGFLLGRGYQERSALKLVGDRYALTQRQRKAVSRASCSKDAYLNRCSKEKDIQDLVDKTLAIDGFNLLITLESALAKGLIIRCADRTFRDLASVHGSYRRVDETQRAIELVGQACESLSIKKIKWVLDRPVSNSGRLKQMLLEFALSAGFNWQVELINNPDRYLVEESDIVVSSDSWVLDHCTKWANLTDYIFARLGLEDIWLLDLHLYDNK